MWDDNWAGASRFYGGGGEQWGDWSGSHFRRTVIGQSGLPMSEEREMRYGFNKYKGDLMPGTTPMETPGAAPSLWAQRTSPVKMHDSAFCRVTRSYESSPITTSSNVGGTLDEMKWMRLYMGNFNTAVGTDGFYANGIVGVDDGLCLAFHFDESKVSGVTAATGPRVVRGGPTSTDYVTSPMTQTTWNGWSAWNNDFFQFLNIFRYSKLDKLELLIKLPNFNRGLDPGSSGGNYTNYPGQWDPGVLYIAPWSGEPGIVNSYTSGGGAMTQSLTNGARNVRFWESKPGVQKVRVQHGVSNFQIVSLPIKPIQPVVVAQSDASGQPIAGSDEVVTYAPMPAVDGYTWVTGAQNHNAFGWSIYWEHQDFAAFAQDGTSMGPWIEICFRATMTWWGLLPPDETAGAALSQLVSLPGAEERMLAWYASVGKNRDKEVQELAASMNDFTSVLKTKRKAALPPPDESDLEIVTDDVVTADLVPQPPLKRQTVR